MVVGDLVVIVNSQTTGFENGEVGLLTKKEVVNRSDVIYWVFMGNYNRTVPFWESEIEVMNESWKPDNCN